MSAAAYRWWGVAFALAGVIGFSFRPILIKLAYAVPTAAGHPVNPTTLLFLRMAIALPFFAVIAWWLRYQKPGLTGRDWAAVAGLGFVGYYLSSLLDFLGLQHVGAGVGRLIQFAYPTLVLVLSFLFLHKRPARRELAALAMTYAGIALVVLNQTGGGAQDRQFLFGALLIFCCALTYAIYLVAGGELIKRVGSMRFTAYTMIVSTLPVALQFFILEPVSALDLPSSVWWYAAVMATFSTVVPGFLVAEALKRVGANHFALIAAVGPVSVAITSALGLDEPFTWLQMAGGMLVISGVLLVSLKQKGG
ncbi:MAG: DMT family transporter [Betaproteobacteria bacterium]|nr:DMT family transporter [Betaproteobacteria bacterium]